MIRSSLSSFTCRIIDVDGEADRTSLPLYGPITHLSLSFHRTLFESLRGQLEVIEAVLKMSLQMPLPNSPPPPPRRHCGATAAVVYCSTLQLSRTFVCWCGHEIWGWKSLISYGSWDAGSGLRQDPRKGPALSNDGHESRLTSALSFVGDRGCLMRMGTHMGRERGVHEDLGDFCLKIVQGRNIK